MAGNVLWQKNHQEELNKTLRRLRRLRIKVVSAATRILIQCHSAKRT